MKQTTMNSNYAIGLDLGSTTFKGVLIEAPDRLLAQVLEPTNPRLEEQAIRGLETLLQQSGLNLQPGVFKVGATGYGRKRVPNARSITEITCHALGAAPYIDAPSLLIDMGGQDTKAIRLKADGKVSDFAMNDKCAAGTGRFLEVILARLQVPFDQVASLVASATRGVDVSSTCTVFAESEVVSLVAQGQPVEGIVKGLLRSLASRVANLAGPLMGSAKLYMSGGVALNRAMVGALEQSLGRPIEVLPNPQLLGAIGAALGALRDT